MLQLHTNKKRLFLNEPFKAVLADLSKSKKEHYFLYTESDSLAFRKSTVVCNTQSCPTWSDWSTSLECSATCGGGTKNEQSTCFYEGVSSTLCEGNACTVNDHVNILPKFRKNI